MTGLHTGAVPPPPTPTGIEALVCTEIAHRQAHGLAKYGITVQANPLPLRAWLQHALEECLDQAVYLRRCIHELDTAAAAPIAPAAPAAVSTSPRTEGA